jgi:hypothetical protein
MVYDAFVPVVVVKLEDAFSKYAGNPVNFSTAWQYQC